MRKGTPRYKNWKREGFPLWLQQQMEEKGFNALTLAQQLDTAADVEILVADAIRLDGDVVGQVPALELPGRVEVRLKPGRGGDEQVEFLKRLYKGELPVSKRVSS